MEEKDLFKDLLKNKLENLESPVRSEIWSSVSSSISSGTAAVGTGMSVLTKIVIGASIVTATATAIFYNSSNHTQEEKKSIETPIVPSEVEEVKIPPVEVKKTHKEVQVINPETPSAIRDEKNIVKQVENKSVLLSDQATNGTIPEKTVDPMRSNPYPKAIAITSLPITPQTSSNDKMQPPKSSKVELILPNIFTPNGDGVNDKLTLDLSMLSEASVVVLTAKGEVVHSAKGEEFNWDGHDRNSNLVPSGSYIYFITGTDINGLTYKKYSALEIKH